MRFFTNFVLKSEVFNYLSLFIGLLSEIIDPKSALDYTSRALNL